MSSTVQVVDLRGSRPPITGGETARPRRNSLKKPHPISPHASSSDLRASRTRTNSITSSAAPVSILRRSSDASERGRPPPKNVINIPRANNVASASYAMAGNNSASSHKHPYHSTSSNVQVRNQQPRERVIYIPSGQPIIIVDERRNQDTPLPTIIRNGQVIMGGDGRTRATAAPNATLNYVVRSADGGSDRGRGTPAQRQSSEVQVARNVSRSHSKDEIPGSEPLKRRDTWGHKNKRPPPMFHHDQRCHSPWHGLKDWWMGVLMQRDEWKRTGNEEWAEARRERDMTRQAREKEFRQNVKAWQAGRRDIPLW